MIENKKSGIRLRHLEQGTEEPRKRDVSPGNPNRKKIFDYNNRKANERPIEEKDPRRVRVEDNASEYEQLIDNLKKKTMEVELRDEAIKYLNKQIEDLKVQLKAKDKEISRLNQEITQLQKTQSIPKRQSLPFKTSQVSSFSYLGDNKYGNSFDKNGQNTFSDRNLHEQISLGNLNHKRQFEERPEQAEILSPFMALNAQPKYDYKPKPHNTSRISNNNEYSYQHSSTDYAGFFKKKGNNQYDFNQEDTFTGKRPSMVDSVNKQLQKFNIFPDPQSKKEIFIRSKLQIQDSRQFKFQQAENGFGAYPPSTF